MKFALIALSLVLSVSALAQSVYTFDCASDSGYIAVKIEAEKFNSQLRQVPAEFEVHSDAGSEIVPNAQITNRLLNTTTGMFKLGISLGRTGSAEMSGNYVTQKGSFSVSTKRTRIPSVPSECRFSDDSELNKLLIF